MHDKATHWLSIAVSLGVLAACSAGGEGLDGSGGGGSLGPTRPEVLAVQTLTLTVASEAQEERSSMWRRERGDRKQFRR